jgi:signal peptidase I
MEPEGRGSRGFALAAALVTFWCSAAIGGIAVRRPRRAAFWLLTDYVWYALMLAAIVTGHPRAMWAGLLGTIAWRIPAAIDTYRIARRGVEVATWPTLIRAWVLLTLGSLVLAAGVVRPFVAEAFKIPSKAMYPTLIVGDQIMVDKLRRTPSRGDVIVFKYPLDPSTDYVKRVVGLPGDVVEITSGRLAVNGVEVQRQRTQEDCPKGPDGFTAFEDAIPCVLWDETLEGRTYRIGTDTVLGERRDFSRKVVDPDHVFVLGDNRENSSDSRVWGTVPLDYVKGIVRFVWWSSDSSGTRWDRVSALVR